MKKKINKKNLIISFVFFLIILTIAISSLYLNIKNLVWFTRFGYDEIKENSVDATVEENIKATISRYGSTLENSLLFRNDLIEANGLFYKMLDIDFCATNDKNLLKLDNGYLSFRYTAPDQDLVEHNNNTVIKLSSYLEKENIEFLYVQTPDVSLYNRNCYDMINFTYYFERKVIDSLTESNVNVFDVQKYFLENFQNPQELFFRTDHHWKPESSFQVYQKLCDILNEKYDMNIEEKYYNKDNYTFTTYKNSCLGSIGKKMGVLYSSGKDDFTVIAPTFKTDYEVNIYNRYNLEKSFEGSFEAAVLDNSFISQNSSDKNAVDVAYSIYLHGDNSVIEIKNKLCDNNKTVMFIKDSYVNPVACFLSTAVENTILLDLRLTLDEKKYINDYIEKYNPDMVVYFLNSSSLYDKDVFSLKIR